MSTKPTDTAQTFAGVSDEWDVDAVREIMSGSGPLDWPTSEKIINRLLAIIDRMTDSTRPAR